MKTTDPSLDIVRQFFLEENPNPERVGCPTEETLRAAAENRLPLNDPARLHMADCSECFAEYRGYRLDWERKQAAKRRFIGWAVAAALLICVVGGSFALRRHVGRNEAPQQIAINTTPPTPPLGGRPNEESKKVVIPPPNQEDPYRLSRPEPRPRRHPPVENSPTGTPPIETPGPAPAKKSNELVPTVLDLTKDQKPAGPRARKELYSLPASNLKLTVILPSPAQEGSYTLRLAKDIDGEDVLASATGDAVTQDGIISLEVKMFLRGKAGGSYYLLIGSKTDGEPKIYDVRIVADEPSSTIK